GKVYEFNEADQSCGLATIDHWLDVVGHGRANVSPDKIPWDAIKTLLTQSVYGGRIDNDFDKQLLESFVESLFKAQSFDLDFALVQDSDSADVAIPEGTKPEHFLAWVQQLPEREPPTWLGLPSNAEKLLLIAKGHSLMGKVRRMKSLTDDEEAVYTPGESDGGASVDPSAATASTDSAGAATQPAWMRTIASLTATWLDVLPASVTTMVKDVERMKSPLFRVFARENQVGRSLLNTVRRDMQDLVQVCAGTLKQTNHLRSLLDDFNKGTIPTHWQRYKVPQTFTMTQWLGDFQQRLTQLGTIAQCVTAGGELDRLAIWFGGLFYPEAFITATRQAVAQRMGWSLEQLQMVLELGQGSVPGNDMDVDGGAPAEADLAAFRVTGLRIEGGHLAKGGNLELSPSASKLPVSQIRWLNKSDPATAALVDPNQPGRATLPVYLNADRRELLFSIPVQVHAQDTLKMSQRAVAVVAGV
ncbi:dynein heavy chain domain-containing protein, partial [Dimargaris cristalligena]